jgi:glycosyltransferase involved in cell wall biosynthesis
MNLSFSIVLETENLGMAGLEDLKDTIASLGAQTFDFHKAREIIIVAAGHISPETSTFIKSLYPWLTIHRVDHKLDYVEAKQIGAKVATGDVVIYIDSDVVYEPTWLENILRGFEIAPGTSIVAGDTLIRGTSTYATAIQLGWMMDAQMARSHIYQTNHLYLNNFAIKRDVILRAPIFIGLPIYRASTVETLRQLKYLGYSVMRAPNARGFHLPPGNIGDLWWRALIYGADAVAKADFYFLYGGKVVEKFSPLRRLWRIPLFLCFKLYALVQRIIVVVRQEPRRIFKVIIAIPLTLLFIAVNMLGCLVALFNRNYLYNKITAREDNHVV